MSKVTPTFVPFKRIAEKIRIYILATVFVSEFHSVAFNFTLRFIATVDLAFSTFVHIEANRDAL